MKTTDADSHLCKSEVEFYETTTTASILKWCKSNGAQKKPTKPKTLNNRQTAGLQTDCYWWPSATGWQETCCSCKFNPKGGRGDEVSYISFINMKMSFFFFVATTAVVVFEEGTKKNPVSQPMRQMWGPTQGPASPLTPVFINAVSLLRGGSVGTWETEPPPLLHLCSPPHPHAT